MKYIATLLLLLFAISGFSQAEFLEKRRNIYVYKGKAYKCDELGEVYKEYQESLDLYISGMKHRSAANTMTYVGLGLLGIGIGGVRTDDLGWKVIGGLSIFGGVLIEFIAIIPRGIASGKLAKARKDFNYEMIRRYGYKEDTSLNLQLNQNGLALVYSF